jgi:hypothetical protein
LREDPTNLDYCLLELSEAFMFPFNDGDSWQKNLNLPLTPIRDLKFKKRKDLIVATHGRAFGY